MITDLSEDLVEEILSRVPATSLKRLRFTCKQWNVLFKDERFAKKHFAKAAKQFEVLMLKENKVYSVGVDLYEIHNDVFVAQSIEFRGGVNDSQNTSIYISNLFHCDGLLLCTTDDYNIVVWNPCLGETRWIQSKTVYKEYTWFALGYQNTTSSCRSYKILKCRYDGQTFREFEIFELSGDSWRVLGVVNTEYMIRSWTGLSFKGNTYWLAKKNKEGSLDTVLLCFEFSSERFRGLCLPFQESRCDTVALSVVRDEKLVLLHQNVETLKLDICVTTNIDQTNELTWSKFLAVDIYTHNCLFAVDVKFFIDEEKKLGVFIGINENILCIIGEDGICENFLFEEYTDESMMRPFVFNYFPSLVRIH